ncbi:MAG: bifunctional diguanylate cyclase/phosphodiesterase [Acidimicrobiales bacterium]
MRDGKSKPSPQPAEAAARSPHTEGIAPGSAHIEAERARVATKKRGTAGPAIAELIAVERKAGRDLAWIVLASVVICTFSISFELVDRLFDLSDALNSRNFNGLITLLLVAPFATGGYAALRYREGMRAQRQLTRLSVHDSLTGLPNRRFLGESFARMLAEQRRGPGRVAVLFMDLAGFKAVNDTYGHDVGDRLMQAVADRLQTAVKPEDAVVRYGGDEFVLVITDVPSTQVAERIATRVVKVIEMPFELGSDRIQISASIGIALAEANCEVPDEVVRDADAAMYQAKAHGPGTLASFDRSMHDRLTPSTAEKRLREAVEREEFSLWYQPIVSLKTRRIVGAEALLRWDHPELGAIRPEDFMPALEDSGLIVSVGRWVIAEACAQSRAWSDALPGGRSLQVNVNLSARQIKQADFVDHLRDIIRSTNANPEAIFLEIDERALTADRGLVWQALRGAKRLGFRLALDDFGAGLSSLRHLHDFELDMLKIEPAYVAGLGVAKRDTAIVQHVIGLAKALSVITLAEAVETSDQMETLRTLGCDLAQGFHFSAPAPASVITKMLTEPVAAPEAQSSTPTQLVNAASWPRDPT